MKLRYVAVVATICVLSANAFAAKQTYRFKVDGRTVIKDHIPQEYKHLGYEVVSSRGFVVKTVPPALTEAEKAALAEQKRREEERQEAIKKQREYDLKLFRMYSQMHDINRARLQKERDMNAYVELQERQITDREKKLEEIQTYAARLERQGKPITEELRSEWQDTIDIINTNKKNIETRKKEFAESMVEFDASEKRLKVLKVYPPGTLEEEIDYQHVEEILAKHKDK